MKTINLVAKHTPKKLEEIRSGGGTVSKIENGLVYFDVPENYPGLGDLAREKFKRPLSDLLLGLGE